MNFRTTLVMILLLVVVGAGAYWIFKRQTASPYQQTSNRTQDVQRVLPAEKFQDDAVTEIDLTTDGRALKFRQEKQEWWQTEPVRFPVDRETVARLCVIAENLRYTTKLKPGEDGAPTLEAMGLAKPSAVLTFHLRKPTEGVVTVRLGTRSADGQSEYLAVDGDPSAYYVPAMLRDWAVSRPAESYRSQRLHLPDSGAISGLAITHNGQTVELSRKDGGWVIVKPNPGRASATDVSLLLDQVKSLSIRQFIDNPDGAEYGLDKPEAVLTFNIGPSDTRTLRIGSTMGLEAAGHYATWTEPGMDRPVVFVLSKDAITKTLRNEDDLRDRRLSVFKTEEVSRIDFKDESGDPTMNYGIEHRLADQSNRSEWRFIKPGPDFSIDQELAEEHVKLVGNVIASGFQHDLEPTGAPKYTMRIESLAGKTPEVLAFYGRKDAESMAEEYVVRRGEEKIGFRVPAGAVSRLMLPSGLLRDRQILRLSDSQVKRIEITSEDGTELRFENRRDLPEKGFYLGDHLEKFQKKAFQVMSNELFTLRAEQWLREERGSATQPSWPMMVTITTTEDKTLRLGVKPGEKIAQLDDLPPFQPSPALLVALQAEFRDPTILMLEKGQKIEEITRIDTRDRVSWLRNRSGGFESLDDSPIDENAAALVWDSVSGLIAQKLIKQPPYVPPWATLRIRVSDGKTYNLMLYGDARNCIASLNNQKWFVLDQDTWKNLIRPVSMHVNFDPLDRYRRPSR